MIISSLRKHIQTLKRHWIHIHIPHTKQLFRHLYTNILYIRAVSLKCNKPLWIALRIHISKPMGMHDFGCVSIGFTVDGVKSQTDTLQLRFGKSQYLTFAWWNVWISFCRLSAAAQLLFRRGEFLGMELSSVRLWWEWGLEDDGCYSKWLVEKIYSILLHEK